MMIARLWRPRSTTLLFETRKKNLSLLLIGSSVLTVGAIAFASYWVIRGLILDSLRERAILTVRSSSEKIDTWLAGRMSEIQTIASTPQVRSMKWDVAAPYLQLEQDRLRDFWMLILVNPNGTYYTTRIGFAKGKNLRDRAYFQLAMKGVASVSDMVISRTTGKRQINISTPIWSFPPANYHKFPEDRLEPRRKSLAFYHLPSDPLQKPRVVGNLAGNIPVSHVTEVVSNTQLGEESYAFALDSKGVPIAHPNEHFLSGLNSFLDSPNPTLSSITQKMVNHEEGVALMQLDGQWVYIAYTPLTNAKWSLALVIPQFNLERKLIPLNLLATVVGGLIILATLATLRQMQQFEKTP
ncbi:hypothetical protein DO97_12395 [Neosynechococcus sphagnicola sy1]|uniref:Cache domain-containing protein n=1 Tax=Neosynechococcus sphagnicola sy1 TaxID=1497020 RepID=A0A098THM9_9CYAN|nr:cache domain-containing protein [Neosynechococcus sphagnicola]KGF72065.1 hypothetical protein DO97_12395 [Neosynechococcus sphagnicola sy1]